MKILAAAFVKSAVLPSQYPSGFLPEIAFAGRSNVGKSSLINTLTQRRGLARTSNAPGCTQLINFFTVNDRLSLVDLPGYGFAKRSKDAREKWAKMLRQYLRMRKNLIYMFVLVDSRIEPQTIDLDFINELGEAEIPFIVVFTKTDKQSNRQTMSHVKAFQKALAASWEELPKTVMSSSLKETGKDEILEIIAAGNQVFNQNEISTNT